MKKGLTLILAVALVGGTAGVAEAAFKAGKYRGRTSAEGPVSFTASSKKVTKFRAGAVYTCTDGDVFQQELGGFPSMKASRSGRFAGSFTGANGALQVLIGGRLKGNRATGTFYATIKFNQDNQVDPNGTVLCTAQATWSAKTRR